MTSRTHFSRVAAVLFWSCSSYVQATLWLDAEIEPPVGSSVEIGQLFIRSASVESDNVNDVVVRFMDNKHLDFSEEWFFDRFSVEWPGAIFNDPTRFVNAEDMDGTVLASALYTNPTGDDFMPMQEGLMAAVSFVHQIRYIDAFEVAGTGTPQIIINEPDFTTATVGAWPIPEPSTLTAGAICLGLLAFRSRKK